MPAAALVVAGESGVGSLDPSALDEPVEHAGHHGRYTSWRTNRTSSPATTPRSSGRNSGSDWIGKISYWIFHHRRWLLILFILITIVLGAMASQLRVQAGFTKMIPLNHPYMSTFLQYQQDFGGANKVRRGR